MEKESTFESVENQLEDKKKIWDKKMADMLKPDTYGYVINEKIRDTVVALNLLGINTTQSDEGNYSYSPIIQFEAPEPENYYVGESDLRAEVLKQKNLPPEVMNEHSPLFNRNTQVDIWTASRDELRKKGAEYTPEFLKYLEDTQKMTEKLQGLIDEYYSHHANTNTSMKVEITYPYNNEIYPVYLHQLPFLQVSNLENNTDEKNADIILAKAQDEMLKFTEYLKNKFFENN